MPNEPEGKHVRFEIKTTQEFLDGNGLTMADVQEATLTLARCLGLKYERFFPLQVRSEHIDSIVETARVLRAVEDFPGFKRHIREYGKGSIEDHLFTARTASWLARLGLSVEFEPETPKDVKNPDLKVERPGKPAVYVECKRIDTGKFFGLEEKQELADLIYEKLPTCDQLNFYLEHEGSAAKIRQLIPDKNFATIVFGSGIKAEESDIKVEGEFKVSVIRKPAIIGAEEDFPIVTVEGWLQNVESGVRLPGYTFMRGGRSISVHGPPPDYRRIWNRKRHTSKHQAVPDHPFVTIILDEDVLGDPVEHERFFNEVWLTKENASVSGVGFLSFARMVGQPSKPRFSYSVNPDAKNPLGAIFFEAFEA